MIIIKTKRSDFPFKYSGNIELIVDDLFLSISADKLHRKPEGLDTWYIKVRDMFWLSDIESIVGY